MLRITVTLLVLAFASGSAFAQMGIVDIKDEVSRLDVRHFTAYKRTYNGRDFFAQVHDQIGHGAFKEMRAARDTYVAIRTEISHAVAANDAGAASKRVPDLAKAGEVLDAKVEKYMNSSASAVQKIYIGLGVFVFVIGGIVFWLFKRRRR